MRESKHSRCKKTIICLQMCRTHKPRPLFKINQEGATGRLWRIIHDIFSKGINSALFDGKRSTPYPILQGVAQGCPPSCMLFSIHVDDPLATLQTDCHSDGVLLNNSAHRLVAESYKDDLAALSGTAHGLQRIIDHVHNHSLLWNWTFNTLKNHIIIFNRRT